MSVKSKSQCSVNRYFGGCAQFGFYSKFRWFADHENHLLGHRNRLRSSLWSSSCSLFKKLDPKWPNTPGKRPKIDFRALEPTETAQLLCVLYKCPKLALRTEESCKIENKNQIPRSSETSILILILKISIFKRWNVSVRPDFDQDGVHLLKTSL